LGTNEAVIFRTAGQDPATSHPEEAAITARFEAVFGAAPDRLVGDEAYLDDLVFIYRALEAPADGEPEFLLRPECDRCASHDPAQFPLEPWVIGSALVLAQARATCRPCRFHLVAAHPTRIDMRLPGDDAD
jgi:hypothetical protein